MSPATRFAETTIGPPVCEMRGNSISIGTSAASAAPSPIARRTRNAFSRAPTCTTSRTTSPRALAIGCDSTGRVPNAIACVVHCVRPSASDSESSFTGTARNITSCMAARSSPPQARTPRATSSSSASTARPRRISVSAMMRLPEMPSSVTPCCSM